MKTQKNEYATNKNKFFFLPIMIKIQTFSKLFFKTQPKYHVWNSKTINNLPSMASKPFK